MQWAISGDILTMASNTTFAFSTDPHAANFLPNSELTEAIPIPYRFLPPSPPLASCESHHTEADLATCHR